MGWFSRNEEPAQQFGVSQNAMGGGYGMGMGMGMGMQDPAMAGMMMQQNPMMQQMANDPVMAMARLLDLRDPVTAFLATPTFPIIMDLFGEVISLALKEFLSQATFKIEGEKLTLDLSALPAPLNTMSAENLGLTMSKVTSQANMVLQQNQQQRTMFLQAHQMSGGAQQQQGFFGSLLGSALGNQFQNGNAQKLAGGLAMGV